MGLNSGNQALLAQPQAHGRQAQLITGTWTGAYAGRTRNGGVIDRQALHRRTLDAHTMQCGLRRTLDARTLQSGLVRAALLLVACATSVDAAASKINVAACDSYWPFVGVGADSQLTGFDIQFWGLLYEEMKRVAQSTSDATVLAALGDAPPSIQVMARDAVLKGVQDGSVDVGLCGFQIDAAQQASIDYSPPIVSSGYRAIVQSVEPDLSGIQVLQGALKGFNE